MEEGVDYSKVVEHLRDNFDMNLAAFYSVISRNIRFHEPNKKTDSYLTKKIQERMGSSATVRRTVDQVRSNKLWGFAIARDVDSVPKTIPVSGVEKYRREEVKFAELKLDVILMGNKEAHFLMYVNSGTTTLHSRGDGELEQKVIQDLYRDLSNMGIEAQQEDSPVQIVYLSDPTQETMVRAIE